MGNGSGKTRAKVVLNHRSVEALKPAPEAYRIPDLRCAGLAIRVAPSGRKTWDCAFRIRGTPTIKRKALGTFPSISLEDARERATALAKAAQAGRDALQEEAEAKEAAAARMKVGELIDEYIKRACAKLRTAHEIEIRLKRALQTVVDRPAETIRRRDLRVLLDKVSDRGVLREAEKQRQSIHAMFKWAVGQDIVPVNPAAGLAPYSSGSLRDRVLSPDEIKALWQWIAESDLTPDMQDSLRLQLCMGTRIGEVAGIHAGEIDQETWLWTLPAYRSKNKMQRVTPLVGQAKEIIKARLSRTERGPLFINETGAALRSNDIGSAIVTRRKRIPLEHFVSHDLRRTVATQMVELGIGLDLVSSILGHQVGGTSTRILTRHYVRTDLVDRKRVALEAWDQLLSQIVTGQKTPTNILQLAGAMQNAP
ncbi:MAG: tyrosine-type recombinase/integrase [Xanthobacteraceae bacterium]